MLTFFFFFCSSTFFSKVPPSFQTLDPPLSKVTPKGDGGTSQDPNTLQMQENHRTIAPQSSYTILMLTIAPGKI